MLNHFWLAAFLRRLEGGAIKCGRRHLPRLPPCWFAKWGWGIVKLRNSTRWNGVAPCPLPALRNGVANQTTVPLRASIYIYGASSCVQLPEAPTPLFRTTVEFFALLYDLAWYLACGMNYLQCQYNFSITNCSQFYQEPHKKVKIARFHSGSRGESRGTKEPPLIC